MQTLKEWYKMKLSVVTLCPLQQEENICSSVLFVAMQEEIVCGVVFVRSLQYKMRLRWGEIVSGIVFVQCLHYKMRLRWNEIVSGIVFVQCLHYKMTLSVVRLFALQSEMTCLWKLLSRCNGRYTYRHRRDYRSVVARQSDTRGQTPEVVDKVHGVALPAHLIGTSSLLVWSSYPKAW